jgi:hypothetical protein
MEQMMITYRDNGQDNEPVTHSLERKPFIVANTTPMTYQEIEDRHIIPIFVKDNEPAVSQTEFIDVVKEVANTYYGMSELKEDIRVSHPIKGRVPEARNKPAKDLNEWEKTLYFERMMFAIELDNVTQRMDGSTLKLTVGGIKAYNQDNLYNSKGAAEHFHYFVGFQNTICCNLCIWTDGIKQSIKASSTEQLYKEIQKVLEEYDAVNHLSALERFTNLELTESQFAQLLGRARLYNYLPAEKKKNILTISFTDTQVSTVADNYYKDENFARNGSESISLWKLYNLFTGANKSSYIDKFLTRGVNAFQLTDHIAEALETGQESWFLS